MSNFTFTSTITPQASGTILCNPANSTASPGFYPLLAGNNITITNVAGSGISISSTGGGGSGNGTVNSAASGLLAYYPVAGTTVSGAVDASINAGTLTLGSNAALGSITLTTPISGSTTINGSGGPANFVLPPNNGSLNQHLATDGAGNTSWNTHSSAQSQLSGNVAMTSANTAYDGPSVTLAAGTWFVSASILIQSTSTSAPVTAKLWTNPVVYASSVIDMPASNASSVTVQAVITLTIPTLIKISAVSSTAGYSILAQAASNTAGLNASTMTAFQL